MKLSAARIFARDLVEAKRFYTEILGFMVGSNGAEYGYCVFETGESQLIVEAVALSRPVALAPSFTSLLQYASLRGLYALLDLSLP